MSIEVIDNFLPLSEFNELKSRILGKYFPWHYSDGIYKEQEKRRWQLFHTFYWEETKSQYFPIIYPLLVKLKVQQLYRIKTNMTARTLFPRGGGHHIDDLPCPYTAIYYVNTNNGYTQFKTGKKIKSVGNRMLIFDSHLLHQGVTTTNEKRMVVVYLNYE